MTISEVLEWIDKKRSEEQIFTRFSDPRYDTPGFKSRNWSHPDCDYDALPIEAGLSVCAIPSKEDVPSIIKALAVSAQYGKYLDRNGGAGVRFNILTGHIIDGERGSDGEPLLDEFKIIKTFPRARIRELVRICKTGEKND